MRFLYPSISLARSTISKSSLSLSRLFFLSWNGRFESDDGIQARFLCLFVELKCSIEVSGIGDGESRHTEGLRLLGKSPRFPESREERIVGVSMKMDEGHEIFSSFGRIFSSSIWKNI